MNRPVLQRASSLSRAFSIALSALVAVSVIGGWLDTSLAQSDIEAIGQGNGPIDIQADQAIEWERDRQVYIARGNAVARRGTLTVRAAVLSAFYSTEGGATEIYRVEASGNVTIETPSQRVTGQNGYYDVRQRIAVMTGDNLQLTTETDTVTARDRLEYQETAQRAFAIGDALAIRGDNRIRADQLGALFSRNEQGSLELVEIDAQGDVIIVTPQDIVRGESGTYNLQEESATMDGNVRITRGDTQLIGETARVNMRTGVATLSSSSGGPVRGIFVPPQDG